MASKDIVIGQLFFEDILVMDCTALLKRIHYFCRPFGELAQLARALAWHARGRRFDSDILHSCETILERPDAIGKVVGSTPIFSTINLQKHGS